MVTEEQAEIYSVYAINCERRIAISCGGAEGYITGFYDDEGDECDLEHAVSAIVTWPLVDLWTAVDLRDYESKALN